MSKHTNKYWLREKEFISLEMEYDFLYSISRNRMTFQESRFSEISRKLNHKFHIEYNGRSAPKWYRNMLNRKQRSKSKSTLSKLPMIDYDYIFEDNFKDSSWYW